MSVGISTVTTGIVSRRFEWRGLKSLVIWFVLSIIKIDIVNSIHSAVMFVGSVMLVSLP